MTANDDYIIFGLPASYSLAKDTAKRVGIKFGEANIEKFLDNEIIFSIDETVRGKKVFVFQSTAKPANDNIMELLIFIDLLKRSSAKEINVIIPYFGYARQDKRNQGRQPITASLISRMIETAGANRVISFDLHAPQIQGFFSIPVDELKAMGIIAKEFKKKNSIKDLVVVSPDHGGVSRARFFSKLLKNNSLSIIDKRRNKPNEIEKMYLIGDVKDKNCVIVDDIIDTGNTIVHAIELLKEQGAKKVFVCATHGVFSKKSIDEKEVWNKIIDAGCENIFITNSISNNIENERVIVIDLSISLSGVINAHINNSSITDFFIKKYNSVL